ncbi:MAG: hypothetical protein CSB16_01570 [Clostridiales bacterium]|nr:MAG: hypothetical protein CSB16_01570 [Clostridiales bacterium]
MKKNKSYTLSIFVFILTAVIVFGRHYILSIIVGESDSSEFVISSVFDFDSKENNMNNLDNIYSDGDYFFVNDGGDFKARDMEGKVVWKDSFGENICMDSNEKNMVIANKKNGDIFIFTREGKQLASAIGTGKLEKVKILSDDRVLSLSSDSSTINIFSDFFKDRKKILIGSGSIVKFDVSESKNELSVLAIDSINGVSTSAVYKYSLDSTFLNAKVFESVLLQIYYWKDSTILVTPSFIEIVDSDYNLNASTEMIGNIVTVSKQGDYIYAITEEVIDDKVHSYKLVSYSLFSKKVEITSFIEQKYDNIYRNGDYIVLSNAKVIEIRDSNGDLVYTKDLDFPVKKIHIFDNGYILASNGKQLSVLKIKK